MKPMLLSSLCFSEKNLPLAVLMAHTREQSSFDDSETE